MTARDLVGLVVNPVAGLGGPAGLHGTDGPDRARLALRRGAHPRAGHRAAATLARLPEHVHLVTMPGAMGEQALCLASRDGSVLDAAPADPTTAADTRRAVAAMRRLGVGLLLFAGGDGTARDVLADAGPGLVCLGIPAGVKMHSSVFAVSPAAAASAVRRYLADPARRTRRGEVLDLAETGTPTYHGELLVPADATSVQRPKQRPAATAGDLLPLGRALAEEMRPGVTYLVGPGRTAKSVLDVLGLPGTLRGVDVIRDGRLVAADATEAELHRLVASAANACLVVSPVGGQGFLLGRGNQQISARVLALLPEDGIRVVSTPQKLAELGGRPLLVDIDEQWPPLAPLRGPIRVLTAPRREVVYPVHIESSLTEKGTTPCLI